MKSAKLSSAEFFLLLRLLSEISPDDMDMDGLSAAAIKKGLEYMRINDAKVNDFLGDTAGLFGAAENLGD